MRKLRESNFLHDAYWFDCVTFAKLTAGMWTSACPNHRKVMRAEHSRKTPKSHSKARAFNSLHPNQVFLCLTVPKVIRGSKLGGDIISDFQPNAVWNFSFPNTFRTEAILLEFIVLCDLYSVISRIPKTIFYKLLDLLVVVCFFFAETVRSILLLRHFGHLSHSCVKTCRNGSH